MGRKEVHASILNNLRNFYKKQYWVHKSSVRQVELETQEYFKGNGNLISQLYGRENLALDPVPACSAFFVKQPMVTFQPFLVF